MPIKRVVLDMVAAEDRNPGQSGSYPVVLDTGEIDVRWFQKGADGWPDVWMRANEPYERFPRYWALTITKECEAPTEGQASGRVPEGG